MPDLSTLPNGCHLTSLYIIIVKRIGRGYMAAAYASAQIDDPLAAAAPLVPIVEGAGAEDVVNDLGLQSFTVQLGQKVKRSNYRMEVKAHHRSRMVYTS
jgi:hypothetical protein